MPHNPKHPDTDSAYKSLIGETVDQFKHMKSSGLKISKIKPGQANPYKSSKDLFNDIRHNNHMYYFPTESGFGSSDASADHPMLQPTGEMHEGKPMLANDIFRIVHDYFGHAKEGNGFGPNGEETAWHHHKQMFSPLAQKALTTETRGQNSWVNFGPHAEHNRTNPANTIYADQKAGLLPDWTLGHPTKKSELSKGVARKKFPFNPIKDVKPHERDSVQYWTRGDDGSGEPTTQEDRDEIPEFRGNAMKRALIRLGAQTKVRRHPVTGHVEFLLHRGVGPEELNYSKNKKGIIQYHGTSSWTPKHKEALGFANKYLNDEGHDTSAENIARHTMSAWIPAHKIKHIPKQIGHIFGVNKPEAAEYAQEYEVIVHPHKTPHADRKDLGITSPDELIQTRVNRKNWTNQTNSKQMRAVYPEYFASLSNKRKVKKTDAPPTNGSSGQPPQSPADQISAGFNNNTGMASVKNIFGQANPPKK